MEALLMGTDVPETGVLPDKNGEPLTIGEYRLFVGEMMNQPAWRAVADKEMDYADGRQLDNELLQKQRELGLPPAVENLITPTLLSVQGYEATIRTDWRVTADGETGGRDVADALNFKLNRAERQSRADKACSDAFRGQIACGIGWVEVTRNPNPFEFPYECGVIHRNAIHWDMKSYKYDLSDARWLIRRRWLLPERLAQFFPEYAGHFKAMGRGGSDWRISGEMLDGGGNTGLADAWGISGRNTVSEEFWFNETTRELAVAEVWYRRWVTADCLRDKKTGRTVEFDGANPNHREMAANGAVLFAASVPRMRRAFVVGDLVVRDEPTPYPHQKFPYVPFFGFREDNTGIPYGYVRNMKYAQDNLNSTNSKLRWGLSAIRTVRTKGIVDMSDEQFRRNIARVDADIVLNKIEAAQPGARFDVSRDFELSAQHWQMLQDSRATIRQISGITPSFMGNRGNATSGRQESIQVEQSNQSLGLVMDNFRQSRSLVGELLLAMIIEDLGSDEQTVVIEGDAITQGRTVVINRPETDPVTGKAYLSNDLQNIRLKVALEDVPSTNSYRSQQLGAMSEAVKSLPPEYQAAVLPFMVSLMDIPFKDKVIEKIKEVRVQETPEQIEARIAQAVQDALAKSGNDIKRRELALKEQRTASEIKEIEARAVQIGVQAAYAAMQAGGQIAAMPQIAPVADAVMQGAGYIRPARGDDPGFPVPAMPPETQIPPEAAEAYGADTGPMTAVPPKSANHAQTGMETPTVSDNL
ncbi:TPA: hypothetical protein ACKNWU_001230 [Neisseria gonorrhoeae]